MSAILLLAAISAGALSAVTIVFLALLALRALRRGTELEAEMKVPSFALSFHLHAHRLVQGGDELRSTPRGDPGVNQGSDVRSGP